MVQAGVRILRLPDIHSQNMPGCRTQDTEQHCMGSMPPFQTCRHWNPSLAFLFCCVVLRMAGCTPQAAVAIPSWQQGQAPQLSSHRQQHIVGALQGAPKLQLTQQQELQQSSLPALDFNQQQSIKADDMLQPDKQVQHQQQQQKVAGEMLRRWLQYKPSPREQEASKKDVGRMSGWHAFSITLVCLLAMAALGVIGYKAMQWYERSKRPGYVELQAIDSAYHRPWVSL